MPPYWNFACQIADEACSAAYAQYETQPTDLYWSAYSHARRQRALTLAEQQRRLFDTRVQHLDPARAHDWNIVKSRDRGIDLRGAIIDGRASLPAKADLLARRYSPPTPGHHLRLPTLGSSPKVTLSEVDAALAKTKNGKAPGADGIHPEFLKYGLDDSGRDCLRSLIDATVYTGYLPHLWKHAYWIPMLKPAKPPEDSASYRPISLTSVVSKVAEKVLDTRIRAHPCCTIDDSQHAFRRTHQSEDALARLMDCTNRSWNAAYVGKFGARQRHSLSSGRASVTLLDLSSAFDNVRYDKFHQRLRQMGFPSYMQRWLMNFLMGRTAQLFTHGHLTRNRQLTRGVPQGTVLGPLIFLLYVNPLVETIRTVPRVEPILFADDITLATVGNTAVECAATTQLAVDKVSLWTADHGLLLAPAKTHALLLTPSTHPEPNAGITIGTTNISVTPQFHPACKLLGVALDSRLSFPRHIAAIRSKASASLRLIQRAITHCGPSIHTLRTFGKALIESRLFYAAGSWGASVSDFEMTHLETTQRDLARAITGIPAAAPSAATLLEANLLPASVVIPTKVVALMERWRRLPPDDLRNKLIHRPLPTPQASQFGRAPTFFPHPWASAETTLNAVLTHRHVSLVHLRIPLLLHRRTPPHQTAGLSKVFIYPTADGAPNALPDKDTPDGATLRKELNRASMRSNTATVPLPLRCGQMEGCYTPSSQNVSPRQLVICIWRDRQHQSLRMPPVLDAWRVHIPLNLPQC